MASRSTATDDEAPDDRGDVGPAVVGDARDEREQRDEGTRRGVRRTAASAQRTSPASGRTATATAPATRLGRTRAAAVPRGDGARRATVVADEAIRRMIGGRCAPLSRVSAIDPGAPRAARGRPFSARRRRPGRAARPPPQGPDERTAAAGVQAAARAADADERERRAARAAHRHRQARELGLELVVELRVALGADRGELGPQAAHARDRPAREALRPDARDPRRERGVVELGEHELARAPTRGAGTPARPSR